MTITTLSINVTLMLFNAGIWTHNAMLWLTGRGLIG